MPYHHSSAITDTVELATMWLALPSMGQIELLTQILTRLGKINATCTSAKEFRQSLILFLLIDLLVGLVAETGVSLTDV
ncbi:hypothetical protein Chor_008399, partial [Crotalus horridus]